jgi:hypothetical protein
MNENDLFSALTSMGFGETLSECKLAFKFGYLLDPKGILSALNAFSLSTSEVTAVQNFINKIK